MSDELSALEPPTVAAVPIAAGNVQLAPAVRSEQHFERIGYSRSVTIVLLVASLAVLALASVLTVGADRRVYFPGVTVPLPETCTLYARFGVDCPGCGLTRSFIHFADGDIRTGLSLNWAGIAIFLFFVVQIPAAVARLVWGRTSSFAIGWTRFNELSLIVLPSLTVIQWLARFI